MYELPSTVVTKYPRGALKQQKFVLTFLEPRNPKSRFLIEMVPSQDSEGEYVPHHSHSFCVASKPMLSRLVLHSTHLFYLVSLCKELISLRKSSSLLSKYFYLLFSVPTLSILPHCSSFLFLKVVLTTL